MLRTSPLPTLTIVILAGCRLQITANPPYVQLQKAITDDGSVKLGDLYAKAGFETFAKTGDIYCLFYEKGWDLLHNNGVLSFITSNKWMRAGYGKLLRAFLVANSNPVQLLDFSGQKIFESATVDVSILVFQKARNQNKTLVCLPSEECKSNLSVYVRHSGSISSYSTSDSWLILSKSDRSVREKIEQSGIPLAEWDLKINRGILTGFNEAFILSGEAKQKIIEEDPKSSEVIRPILRGRDIKRYHVQFADLWLINTHNGIKGKCLPVNPNEYPAIKRHLDHYYEKLAKRADKGDSPYNLRNCAYLDDFSKQKIVWGNLCLSSQFALAEEGMFVNAPSPLIVPGNKYLLAVLNSKLGDWYIRQLGVTRNGGYFEYKPMFVEKLPVPQLTKEQQQPFVDLVDQILFLKTSGLPTQDIENNIDRMIYALYDLTPQEIAIIEQNCVI